MRPWVLWCFKHRLSFIVYLLVVAAFPLIWCAFVTDAFMGIKELFQSVKEAHNKYKEAADK